MATIASEIGPIKNDESMVSIVVQGRGDSWSSHELRETVSDRVIHNRNYVATFVTGRVRGEFRIGRGPILMVRARAKSLLIQR